MPPDLVERLGAVGLDAEDVRVAPDRLLAVHVQRGALDDPDVAGHLQSRPKRKSACGWIDAFHAASFAQIRRQVRGGQRSRLVFLLGELWVCGFIRNPNIRVTTSRPTPCSLVLRVGLVRRFMHKTLKARLAPKPALLGVTLALIPVVCMHMCRV